MEENKSGRDSALKDSYSWPVKIWEILTSMHLCNLNFSMLVNCSSFIRWPLKFFRFFGGVAYLSNLSQIDPFSSNADRALILKNKCDQVLLLQNSCGSPIPQLPSIWGKALSDWALPPLVLLILWGLHILHSGLTDGCFPEKQLSAFCFDACYSLNPDCSSPLASLQWFPGLRCIQDFHSCCDTSILGLAYCSTMACSHIHLLTAMGNTWTCRHT